MMNQRNVKIALTLSLIEGGAVMFAEIVSAKMIAPVFGTSLYVWTSVLTITLTGLMIGYFLGGKSNSYICAPSLSTIIQQRKAHTRI